MKKAYLLLVFIFNLFSLTNAQISLNIHGGFIDSLNSTAVNAYACQSNTFNLVFLDSDTTQVNPGTSLYLKISNEPNIEFPTLISLPADTSSRFYLLHQNSGSTVDFFSLYNVAATFQMDVNCDIINPGQTANIQHTIGLYLNGNLSVSISGDFNGTAISSNQIAYDILFPYLAIQSAANSLLADYVTVHLPDNRIERILSFVNQSGDSVNPMDLKFTFSDILDCPSFSFDSIQYYINGGSPIGLDTTIMDSLIYTSDTTTVHIRKGEVLYIRELIHVLDNNFINGCTQSERLMHSNLNWGCATLCKNIYKETRVERGNLRPNLTINRVTPSNTPTIKYYAMGYYWDTMFSQQPVQNYTFRVANRDSDIENHVSIRITDTRHSSMYFIADTSGIVITPYFNASNRNLYSTSTPYDTTHKRPSCVIYNYPHAVDEFIIYLDYLMPFDSIDVTIPLTYCCPNSDNGTDTSAIDLFENAKLLNSWNVEAQGNSAYGESDGQASTAYVGGGLFTILSWQFSFNESQYLDQLYLKQSFIPNSITFSVPHDSACSQYASLALNNYQFSQDPTGKYLYADANLFTRSYSSTATDTILVDSLLLQFQIKTEPGLQLDSVLLDYSITGGVHTWYPSSWARNHRDSCSLDNIYTVNFSSADFPFLNPAVPFLSEIYDVVNSGVFHFNIKGCCCPNNQNNNPGYKIETLIAGYDQCFVPMSRVLGHSEIHCPGCQMPGTIVETQDDEILKRLNYGFKDSLDDGLADFPLQKIDSAYIANQQFGIDLNHSMVGDTLSSLMQVKIDDTGTLTLASLAADSGIYLKHLYAEQKIENSNSHKFDLHVYKLVLTARNQSVTINQSSPAWSRIVKDVRDSTWTGVSSDIIFYNLSASVLDSIFGIANFAFASNEVISLRTFLKVCGNYRPDSSSKHLADNQFSSKVALNMYLTDANLDSLHIYNAFTDPDPTIGIYPRAQETGVGHNKLYMCETRSTMHYFYSIYAKSTSRVYNDPNQQCLRFLEVKHEMAIGGEAINPFRSEFRPIPEFNPISFNLPGGYANYTFFSGSGYSDVRTYYTSSCGIPSTHRSITLPASLVFNPIYHNIHALASDTLLINGAFTPACGSVFQHSSNTFYSSDEYLNQTLLFPFIYNACSDTTFSLGVTAVNTTIQLANCAAANIAAYQTLENNTQLISSNFVNHFQVSPPLGATAMMDTVAWSLHLYNNDVYDHSTRNLFIYFQDTLLYSDISVGGLQALHYTLTNGKRIVLFKIGNAPSPSFNIYEQIKIRVNDCSVDSIPFVVGFDCLGYPTLAQIQNGQICQVDTGYLHLETAESIVTAHIDQNIVTQACAINSVTANCILLGANINNFKFIVDLTNPFTQLISEHVYHVVGPTTTSVSFATTNTGLYHYEFTPNIAHDSIVSGDTLRLVLTFTLLDTTNSSPFRVDYQYINPCGDIGPPTIQNGTVHAPLTIGGFHCDTSSSGCFVVLANQNTINCSGQPVSITTSIIGHPTGLHYQWSSNPTGANDTTASITPNPTVPTTYTVVVTSASGNSSSATVTVLPIQGQCCIPSGFSLSGGDILLNKTSASAYIQQYFTNSISTQNLIYIADTFTVDENFTFSHCPHIIMAPGAAIVVQSTKRLTLFDTHQYSCGAMWAGMFTAGNNASFDLKGAIVEDAQYAVHLGHKSSLKAVASFFRNNYISVNAVSPNSGSMQIGLNISNTDFESTRNLRAKFMGQTPLPYSHPYAGIVLSNVINVDMNPKDTINFRSLNTGILASKTNLNMSKCCFDSILNFDNTYSYPSNVIGSAIYAVGSFGGGNSITFSGYNDSLVADFENCINGIKTSRMSLIDSNTTMKNVDVGIEVAKMFMGTTIIQNNNIECNLTGISLLQNSHPSNTTVLGNRINGGRVVVQNSGNASNAIGIDIQGNSNNALKNHFLIANNRIHLYDFGKTGIHVNSSKFINIAENFITLENNGINTSMNGISMENSQQSAISCNMVNGTRTNQSIDYNEAAILYTSSLGNLISQNSSCNTAQGIEVIGTCANGLDQTIIGKNFINFHFNGIKYHGSVQINQQEHTANQWVQNFTYSGFGGINYDTLHSLNQKFIVEGSGASKPYNNSWYPGGWFVPDGQPDSTIDSLDCELYTAINPNPIPVMVQLSNDSILTLEYQQEMNWQTKVEVYQKLLEHPEYLSENADLADFYILNAVTSIHYIASLNVENNQLLQNQNIVLENIKNNSITIYQKSHGLKSIYNQMENTELKQEEIDSLIALSDQYMVELDQSIMLNEFYVEQLKNSIGNRLDLIGQLTDSISTTEIYEANEKIMSDIGNALNFNESDSLLYTFSDPLYSIATQCPLSGGNAVFKARAYYKLINPNIDYDDYYTCIQSGVVYRKKDVAQQYCNLYPNPSSGLVFVSYSVATDATLEIINAFGQILVAKKLDPTSTNMKLDISNYLNGIYFYRIHDQQNLINTGKLILTK